tara:strand:+ start:425 stop:580 length:156 start_codon:yes stop_codon:yes gene_type:complete
MNRDERNKALVKVFSNLGNTYKANLQWHIDNNTKIFCGIGADDMYFGGNAF